MRSVGTDFEYDKSIGHMENSKDENTHLKKYKKQLKSRHQSPCILHTTKVLVRWNTAKMKNTFIRDRYVRISFTLHTEQADKNSINDFVNVNRSTSSVKFKYVSRSQFCCKMVQAARIAESTCCPDSFDKKDEKREKKLNSSTCTFNGKKKYWVDEK